MDTLATGDAIVHTDTIGHPTFENCCCAMDRVTCQRLEALRTGRADFTEAQAIVAGIHEDYLIAIAREIEG